MAEVYNTFEKGVNKENDYPFQPEGTVRDAINFRVITNKEGSSVSIQDVEGNKKKFDLLPGYVCIGWTQQENHIIIFSTNNPIGPHDGNGAIAVYDVKTNKIEHIYNHQDLAFNDNHQIECVAIKEIEKIRRCYFTDNYNPPRVIDYGILLDYPNIVSGLLVPGKQYMVVQGDIVHNGVNYGTTHFSLPPNNVSTVFTAVNNSYTIINGPVKVIEYFNLANLQLVPEMNIGSIQYYRTLLNGSLLHGGYCYAYQLETENGFRTNWSYVSDMINLAGPNEQTDTKNAYNNYQGNASTISTNKSIQLIISNIDTNFKKINIAYIHYTDLNTASNPVVFLKTNITGSTMIITHSSMIGEAISFEELLQNKINIIKAKTITTLKNKLFFGNIEYNKIFNVNAREGVIFNAILYSVPSDYGDDINGFSVLENSYSLQNLIGHPAVDGVMTANGSVDKNVILTDQWYEVLSGTVFNNDGTPYTAGDIFQGSLFNGSYATGGGQYRAIIRIRKYGNIYDNIPILGEYLDNKGIAVSHYLKSYWRSETYRFGILLYDNTFNPMYVMWLGDYTMPYHINAPLSYLYNNRLNLVHLGARFSNISIFKKIKENLEQELGVTLTYNDLTKYIGGWSIVRARRDPQIFGQGVLHPTIKYEGNDSGNFIRPVANVSKVGNLDGNVPGHFKQYVNYKYIWDSPEIAFNYPGIYSKFSVPGVELKIASYYGILGDTSTAGKTDSCLAHAYIESQDGSTDYGWYRKYYDWKSWFYGYINQDTGEYVPGIYPNIATPVNMGNKLIPNTSSQIWNIIAFPNTSYVIGNTQELFYARAKMFPSTWISDNIELPASKTMMVSTTYAENAYPNFHYFGTNYIADNQHATIRALANLVIPKNNLYGGTSELALANTKYIFCNHFQKMDSSFINYLTSTNGIVNDVEVWGGDCYVTLWGKNRIMKEEPDGGEKETLAFSEIFPIESNINTFLSEGMRFVKYGTFGPAKTNAISYSSPATPEDFIYNFAYSSEESYLDYPGVPIDFKNNTKFSTRIIYSKTKIIGENIDNFRIFLPNQYVDVETWPGEINNIRGKNSYIFYWQPNGVGYSPVNERAGVSNVLGSPIMLGQTGVLDRFDDLTLFYGNRHQWGLCETETHFVWFDISKKCVCVMPLSGGKIQEISISKGYRGHFNDFIAFFENDKSVIGKGIHSFYDSKFKEVIFIFSNNFYYPDETYYTIGFSTINMAFTGSYKCKIGLGICVNNRVFVQPASPKSYSIIAGNTFYKEGDLLANNSYTAVYICKQDYVSAPFPVDPELDSTNWQLLFTCNNIFEQNVGDIGKFFGKVYNSELEFVVKSQNQMPVVFDNMRWNTRNENFFTRIKYFNSSQYAEDIVNNDVEGDYYFQNKQWYNNIPFHDNSLYNNSDIYDSGRMYDSYLVVRGIKENYLNGSYTKSSNKKMILSLVLTKFRFLK